MSTLTTKEAFLAAFAFIEDRYNIIRSDDLANMLSDMSLLSDCNTADPAVWHEWCAAVEKAKSGEVDARVKLTK